MHTDSDQRRLFLPLPADLHRRLTLAGEQQPWLHAFDGVRTFARMVFLLGFERTRRSGAVPTVVSGATLQRLDIRLPASEHEIIRARVLAWADDGPQTTVAQVYAGLVQDGLDALAIASKPPYRTVSTVTDPEVDCLARHNEDEEPEALPVEPEVARDRAEIAALLQDDD